MVCIVCDVLILIRFYVVLLIDVEKWFENGIREFGIIFLWI